MRVAKKCHVLAAIALGLALAAASTAVAARAPAGKTYFVVSVGVATDESEAYEIAAGCVSFTADEICAANGDCGSWWRTEEGVQTRKQTSFGFEFTLVDDETGLPVEVDGKGRVDTAGSRSSIGGVARAVEPSSGTEINFTIGGRAVGSARCLSLVEDFDSANQ